ncbi:helix-turn-helix domain-containing protein [uncultured Anaerococcus sp.]|uniref:helix-turn-helix domain-containing protein n=1 Tax=uncultured Anaerococcus sp. TaxID=293428 RepID=UPI00288B0EFD|nr:helix-turn-helix domain-containing protein [uncultured Anaerococcus sp.]
MKATYYTILPAEIRLDKRLSAFEKILFSDILALANKKGYCYATNQYFAKIYQMSISSISHAISKLVDLDFIKRIYEYKDKTKMIERRKLYVQINNNIPIKNFPYPLVENTKQDVG